MEPNGSPALPLDAGLALAAALRESDMPPAVRDSLATSLQEQIDAATQLAQRVALKRVAAELFFEADRLNELCRAGEMGEAVRYVAHYASASSLMGDPKLLRFCYKLHLQWATSMLQEEGPAELVRALDAPDGMHQLLVAKLLAQEKTTQHEKLKEIECAARAICADRGPGQAQLSLIKGKPSLQPDDPASFELPLLPRGSLLAACSVRGVADAAAAVAAATAAAAGGGGTSAGAGAGGADVSASRSDGQRGSAKRPAQAAAAKADAAAETSALPPSPAPKRSRTDGEAAAAAHAAESALAVSAAAAAAKLVAARATEAAAAEVAAAETAAAEVAAKVAAAEAAAEHEAESALPSSPRCSAAPGGGPGSPVRPAVQPLSCLAASTRGAALAAAPDPAEATQAAAGQRPAEGALKLKRILFDQLSAGHDGAAPLQARPVRLLRVVRALDLGAADAAATAGSTPPAQGAGEGAAQTQQPAGAAGEREGLVVMRDDGRLWAEPLEPPATPEEEARLRAWRARAYPFGAHLPGGAAASASSHNSHHHAHDLALPGLRGCWMLLLNGGHVGLYPTAKGGTFPELLRICCEAPQPNPAEGARCVAFGHGGERELLLAGASSVRVASNWGEEAWERGSADKNTLVLHSVGGNVQRMAVERYHREKTLAIARESARPPPSVYLALASPSRVEIMCTRLKLADSLETCASTLHASEGAACCAELPTAGGAASGGGACGGCVHSLEWFSLRDKSRCLFAATSHGLVLFGAPPPAHSFSLSALWRLDGADACALTASAAGAAARRPTEAEARAGPLLCAAACMPARRGAAGPPPELHVFACTATSLLALRLALSGGSAKVVSTRALLLAPCLAAAATQPQARGSPPLAGGSPVPSALYAMVRPGAASLLLGLSNGAVAQLELSLGAEEP